MKKQSGFTLIELIVVIIIIGILAAVAVPRFINQSKNARIAVVNGLYGAMQTAALLIYTQSNTEGEAAQAAASVTVEGQPITTVFGYPTDGVQLGLAMRSMDGFTSAATGISVSGYTPATCGVEYTAAADATTPPVFTKQIGGC